MKKLLLRYIDRFNSGHARSVKARKNILASFFIKGVSIIIGFVFVPLLIGYLGEVEYGIWITMSSILAWVNYFDIGLGNGLRNRFAESLAKGEHQMARIYVSTAYASLSMLFGSFFLVFIAINPLLSWYEILKAPVALADELNMLVIITFGFFLLRFTLRLIAIIIIADQRPALSNVFDPLANLISLLAVLVLIQTSETSLLALGIILGSAPVIVLALATIYYFRRDYRDYRPSIRLVDFKYFKDLTGLGAKFFIIQITVVIIMSTNNFIITRVVGPEAVTAYNIAYKYFGLLLMLFTIITNTYWSAYTEAYFKKDFIWIRRVTGNLVKGWIAILLILAAMLIFAPYFYHVWIRDKVEIPFLLSAFTALFIGIYIWYIIFIYFINGTGKITLQLYVCVIVAVLNIPVSVFFARYLGMGSAGVILGSCVTYLPGAIIAPIQYRKIITGRDHGIWGK
ncbi:MAG: lipopolysaccharide biosynthesis protein [Lentimicrobium sp.]